MDCSDDHLGDVCINCEKKILRLVGWGWMCCSVSRLWGCKICRQIQHLPYEVKNQSTDCKIKWTFVSRLLLKYWAKQVFEVTVNADDLLLRIWNKWHLMSTGSSCVYSLPSQCQFKLISSMRLICCCLAWWEMGEEKEVRGDRLDVSGHLLLWALRICTYKTSLEMKDCKSFVLWGLKISLWV